MNAAEDALVAAWRGLAGNGHADVETELVGRHAEPHRRYHTAEHVMWVLAHIDTIVASEAATDPIDVDAIRAGALFHDIVYEPRSATNERDSAVIAVAALEAVGWQQPRLDCVRDIIEATATHRADTTEARVLLDADLAVLGGDPDAYAGYVAGVRYEYSFVDDTSWRSGRATVLRSFLDRDHIFVSDTMSAQREATARRNLTNELAELVG